MCVCVCVFGVGGGGWGGWGGGGGSDDPPDYGPVLVHTGRPTIEPVLKTTCL